MFENKEAFKKEFEKRLIERYGRSVPDSHITERYEVLGEMIRDYAGIGWRNCRDDVITGKKQCIYFSMEFLIGRLMKSNLENLGVRDLVKDGLADYGIRLEDLEEQEPDAGLGNGGLGRLAACFLDSAASLGLPMHGNTIRYEYGFFRQKFVNGRQMELPDEWLSNGFVFEVRKPKHAVEVEFGGNAETYLKPNGEYALRTVNATHVRAVPYDVSIPGYRNGVANTLRLWSAEPSEENLPTDVSFNDYLSTLKELSFGLYPDDSTEHGRLLRLRQQYFLVSAGLQSVLRAEARRYGDLTQLKDHYVFQLNDTHPILAIPEMMRLLMDVYGMGWDEAWDQVRHCFAYTNHTIMPEALERWPVTYVQKTLPRVYMIIEEINRRFLAELAEEQVEPSKIQAMQIIKDGQILMTNMAIHAVFSVNGVAKIHTEILEHYTFKEFYELYPEKFSNKTNGVTHRRWLMYANPRLTHFISEKIGENWKIHPDELEKFKAFDSDPATQKAVMDIKAQNKADFADYLEERYGVLLPKDAIVDVQIKRLHAYKRQLLNLFHIMALYQKLKADPKHFSMHPHLYVFGAKAAPSYEYAKRIIELILAVQDVINNDPDAAPYMKIVFVENYGVSLAERIIPAADISEQISTAGREASGTSNMKLMMNGALTLGTLDGANIEIVQRAGKENAIIFGMTVEEVEKKEQERSYNPWDIYNANPVVKNVIDSLFNGPWAVSAEGRFQLIFDELMNRGDPFFVLADFDAYAKACEEADRFYEDKPRWAKAVIDNIATSGIFSSDRTIGEYNRDIWHLEPYSLQNRKIEE
ncbi:MAG: glycogen/starch/alpha-glucan phosphorylase [Erysipelotrichaceae bacterium]|nr:glycogen/starch/alpha-glucan phosphorylase [Erysipelotrichaceae bacterium]